jgi:hypothetical protein
LKLHLFSCNYKGRNVVDTIEGGSVRRASIRRARQSRRRGVSERAGIAIRIVAGFLGAGKATLIKRAPRAGAFAGVFVAVDEIGPSASNAISMQVCRARRSSSAPTGNPLAPRAGGLPA